MRKPFAACPPWGWLSFCQQLSEEFFRTSEHSARYYSTVEQVKKRKWNLLLSEVHASKKFGEARARPQGIEDRIDLQLRYPVVVNPDGVLQMAERLILVTYARTNLDAVKAESDGLPTVRRRGAPPCAQRASH